MASRVGVTAPSPLRCRAMVSLHPQNVIAVVWDFDRTLIPGYMQDPLFAEEGIDAARFWEEVTALPEAYARRGITVGRETCYLGHILTYAAAGRLGEFTRERLMALGAALELCPGMPDFLAVTKALVADDPTLAKHGIAVEHYVVSTGFRAVIEGSRIAQHVDGIWANDFIDRPFAPGFLDDEPIDPDPSAPLTHLGYVLDDTTKTRAVFEINKGVNADPRIQVNAPMSSAERRVPFEHMLYVADGPSDVPVFSVVAKNGGRTFGVYTKGERDNFRQVKALSSQGRIHGMAEADYRPEEEAALWITETIREIATGIVSARGEAVARMAPAPRH